MNTHHKQKTTSLSYYELLAYSLIEYAQKNKNFSDWMQSVFTSHQAPFLFNTNISQHVALPRIDDERQALRRVQWLITLGSEYTQQVMPALEVLTQWANIREREEPKAFILGLVMGVEPFGIWGEPTNKHQPIDILVKKSVYKKIKRTTLAKMSVTLANEIVQKALIEVNGNANILEPELSDWFFGDKTIVFYSADEKTLTSIESTVTEMGAPYARRGDENGTTFFAVGPTLYINDFVESDLLEEIV